MANYPRFEVEGIQEIIDALEGKVKDLVGLKFDAMKEGAEYLKEKMVDAAPTDGRFTKQNLHYGTLKENIKIGFGFPHAFNDKKDPYYYVSNGDAYWGYFLEIGTRPLEQDRVDFLTTGTGKRGKKRTKERDLSKIHGNEGIPPKPWFEPCWNANKVEVHDIIMRKLKEGL